MSVSISTRLREWADHFDKSHATTNKRTAMSSVMLEAADELERLHLAIRRLADQDATLSVQGGNVIVDMDATLTEAEREAVEWARCIANMHGLENASATLRGLLERLK